MFCAEGLKGSRSSHRQQTVECPSCSRKTLLLCNCPLSMVRAGHGVVCSFLHDGGRLASPGLSLPPWYFGKRAPRCVAKLPFLSPPADFVIRSSHAYKFCFLSTLDLAAEYLPCIGPFWDSQQIGNVSSSSNRSGSQLQWGFLFAF